MTRRWLCSWLLSAAFVLASPAAWGEFYQARGESLQTFFTALSLPLGISVLTSRQVAQRPLSGTFDFDVPQQVLEVLVQQEGLIWHSDGQVLYLYDAAEARSSAVVLRHITVDRLLELMHRTGLEASRYPLRKSAERTFYVSGPPSYVDQVLRLAQLMDRKRTEVRVGAQVFRVVRVLNSDVADRQHVAPKGKITVPGMASAIEARLSREQKGWQTDRSFALIAYPDANSLLIKGTPAQVRRVEKWVAELDVPQPSDQGLLHQVDVGAGDGESMAVAGGRLPLTADQYKRVQRAFMRPGREISP